MTKRFPSKYRIQYWGGYGDINYTTHANNKIDIRKWIKKYPNTRAYVEIRENDAYRRVCHIKDFK